MPGVISRFDVVKNFATLNVTFVTVVASLYSFAYMAICGLGAVVNVQSAGYLFHHSIPWWFAGAAGALIGAVWNYAVSTQIVWTWLPSLLRRKDK